MSLIICPECKNKISDQAEYCVHCGYPIKNDHKENVKFNVILVSNGNDIVKIIRYLRELLNLNLMDAKHLTDNLPKCIIRNLSDENAQSIATDLQNMGAEVQIVQNEEDEKFTVQQKSKPAPQCPTCHSTNIKRVTTSTKVKNTIIFGLLGNKRKKQFHCNNCGYEW